MVGIAKKWSENEEKARKLPLTKFSASTFSEKEFLAEKPEHQHWFF